MNKQTGGSRWCESVAKTLPYQKRESSTLKFRASLAHCLKPKCTAALSLARTQGCITRYARRPDKPHTIPRNILQCEATSSVNLTSFHLSGGLTPDDGRSVSDLPHSNQSKALLLFVTIDHSSPRSSRRFQKRNEMKTTLYFSFFFFFFYQLVDLNLRSDASNWSDLGRAKLTSFSNHNRSFSWMRICHEEKKGKNEFMLIWRDA